MMIPDNDSSLSLLCPKVSSWHYLHLCREVLVQVAEYLYWNEPIVRDVGVINNPLMLSYVRIECFICYFAACPANGILGRLVHSHLVYGR